MAEVRGRVAFCTREQEAKGTDDRFRRHDRVLGSGQSDSQKRLGEGIVNGWMVHDRFPRSQE